MNEITIYKIYCKNESIKDIYIGSTSNFKKRSIQHKHCCNTSNGSKYNNYKYIFIRENGGWDNWIMESITTCSKEEQYKMERWHIENVEHTNLNKTIPCRTEEELNEIKKEYKKQYREVNKEKMKQHREVNKDKKKAYDKQHYDKNKEKIIEQSKQYSEANKEKMKEKITCECGSIYRKSNKTQHNKSNKHQNFLKINE